MIVTEQEYNDMFKEIDGIMFSPIVKLIEEEIEIDGDKVKVFKYEILKTTDEVYQEYLNPPKVQQVTEQQVLNAKLLQDNANMQLELEQQKQLNAQILLQIAGGITNA